MRALLWLLTLFALAAGVALAAHFNDGYLLLVLPPYRAEISLNLALLLLLTAFVVVYGMVRGIALTASLPRRVREFRARRRGEKADAALYDLVRLLLEGRFSQVLKLAGEVHAAHRHAALVALLAARAAQRLGEAGKQAEWLGKARMGDPALLPASYMIEAEMHLAGQQSAAALLALDKLHDGAARHFAAVQLELRARRGQGDHDEVLRLVRLLEKHGALEAGLARRYCREAHEANIAARRTDRDALRDYLRQVPPPELDAVVVHAAARALAALGDDETARYQLEASLAVGWEASLVALYGELPGDPSPRIACAESWLPAHREDAGLLLTLGRLCLTAQLWGAAQSYLEASLALADTRTVRLLLARLFDATGRSEAALPHYRAAAELFD